MKLSSGAVSIDRPWPCGSAPLDLPPRVRAPAPVRSIVVEEMQEGLFASLRLFLPLLPEDVIIGAAELM